MTSESLWKIIGRFDSYAMSTNQKGAVVIGYNTIIVGGIVLKQGDILSLYAGHTVEIHLAAFLLCIVTAISLASIWLTFFMVLPYLWSPRKANSALFYGDVAGHENAAGYIDEARLVSEEALERDLATQTYAMAKGVLKKFWWMRVGILLILIVQLPALGCMVAIKLFTLL